MAPGISESYVGTNGKGSAGLQSSLADAASGLGFEIVECEPITQNDFRMLMLFIVVATFAFGCIVNGWLA